MTDPGRSVPAEPRAKRWHLSTPAIAGLIAMISGAVALAFTLAPSLKPDPGTNLNGEMTVLAVEKGAKMGEWLDQIGRKAEDPADRALGGTIVYLSIEVNGRKRQDLELTKTLHHTLSGRRLDAPAEVGGFESETPSDRWVATVWQPDPGDGRRFFVRYALVDRDTILAIAATPALRSR